MVFELARRKETEYVLSISIAVQRHVMSPVWAGRLEVNRSRQSVMTTQRLRKRGRQGLSRRSIQTEYFVSRPFQSLIPTNGPYQDQRLSMHLPSCRPSAGQPAFRRQDTPGTAFAMIARKEAEFARLVRVCTNLVRGFPSTRMKPRISGEFCFGMLSARDSSNLQQRQIS